jgi:phage terminase small subunit
MSKLTIKQDKFVKAYLLNGGNSTKAALEAGYSERTASEMGYENLRKPQIKEAIDEHQKKTQKDFIWSKEKKLELLQRIVNVAATEDGEKGMINMQSAIAAIKEHNLMQGDNAPVESNTNIKVDKPLAEMITGGSKR